MIGLGAANFTVLAYDMLHSNLKIKYSYPALPTSCFGFFTFYSRPSSHLLHEPQLLLGTSRGSAVSMGKTIVPSKVYTLTRISLYAGFILSKNLNYYSSNTLVDNL